MIETVKTFIAETSKDCISAFSRSFTTIELQTGQTFDINCRSWRCPKHRQKWSKRWSEIIAWAIAGKENLLLVNLTTAAMTEHRQIENALRWWIKRVRSEFGPTEYVKVVEYNKKHTQPHFHLILSFKEKKIPELPEFYREKKNKHLSYPENIWNYIRDLWTEALRIYVPNNPDTIEVWCQPPLEQGSAATKYAVKYATGGNSKEAKNEEPDETWRGRKITYSKGFLTRTASDIWNILLDKWFPDRHNQINFFSLIINPNISDCDSHNIKQLMNKHTKRMLLISHCWQQSPEYGKRAIKRYSSERFGDLPPLLELLIENGQFALKQLD